MDGGRGRGHRFDFFVDIPIVPAVGQVRHFQAGAGLDCISVLFNPEDILSPVIPGAVRRINLLHLRLPEDDIRKVRIRIRLQVLNRRETGDFLLKGAAGRHLEALHIRLETGLGRHLRRRCFFCIIIRIDGFRRRELDLSQVLLLQALGKDIPGIELPIVFSLLFFIGIDGGQRGFRPVPAGLVRQQAEGIEAAEIAVGPRGPDSGPCQSLYGCIKVHGFLSGYEVAEVSGHIESVCIRISSLVNSRAGEDVLPGNDLQNMQG